MTFVRTESTAPVRDALTSRIGARLEDRMPILFLVSGGSTADIAVDVCSALQARFIAAPGLLKLLLTVSLIDERFGVEGHPDSNWRLLLEKGLRTGVTQTMPLLSGSRGLDGELEDATNRFDAFLSDAVQRAKRGGLYIAGLLGIGTDGHTAGILPESPASLLAVDGPSGAGGSALATGYRSALFSRITVTPAFFPHFDFAVVYAAGRAKLPVLAELEKEKPVREQPAQLLKLAKETLIFSDMMPVIQGTAE